MPIIEKLLKFHACWRHWSTWARVDLSALQPEARIDVLAIYARDALDLLEKETRSSMLRAWQHTGYRWNPEDAVGTIGFRASMAYAGITQADAIELRKASMPPGLISLIAASSDDRTRIEALLA